MIHPFEPIGRDHGSRSIGKQRHVPWFVNDISRKPVDGLVEVGRELEPKTVQEVPRHTDLTSHHSPGVEGCRPRKVL